jgi:IS30 family transposase
MARKIYSYDGASCEVSDCKSPAEDNRMCGKHAQRVRRYGDPNYITPERVRRLHSSEAQRARKRPKSHVYKKLMGRHEHRAVAETMLGRKLRPDEIVHHKDRNKHNNSPENLEIITRAQHVAEHKLEMTAGTRAHAKLSPQDIGAIKSLLSVGISQSEIGRRFGVCQSLVSRIKRGKAWVGVS